MAAKRVLQSSVNWIELAERVPVSQKSNLAAFKAKSEGFLRRVKLAPEQAPQIDWAYYKTNAENKAVVEQFEKAYNSMKVPYPSGEAAIQAIEVDQKKWNDDLKIFIEHSNERIKKYEEELKMYRESIPFFHMYREEQYIAYPEIAVDAINKPTLFPHIPSVQNTPEDIEFYRKEGEYYRYPDKYHP